MCLLKDILCFWGELIFAVLMWSRFVIAGHIVWTVDCMYVLVWLCDSILIFLIFVYCSFLWVHKCDIFAEVWLMLSFSCTCTTIHYIFLLSFSISFFRYFFARCCASVAYAVIIIIIINEKINVAFSHRTARTRNSHKKMCCLSHLWSLSKWLNIFFHHRVATSF